MIKSSVPLYMLAILFISILGCECGKKSKNRPTVNTQKKFIELIRGNVFDIPQNQQRIDPEDFSLNWTWVSSSSDKCIANFVSSKLGPILMPGKKGIVRSVYFNLKKQSFLYIDNPATVPADGVWQNRLSTGPGWVGPWQNYKPLNTVKWTKTSLEYSYHFNYRGARSEEIDNHYRRYAYFHKNIEQDQWELAMMDDFITPKKIRTSWKQSALKIVLAPIDKPTRASFEYADEKCQAPLKYSDYSELNELIDPVISMQSQLRDLCFGNSDYRLFYDENKSFQFRSWKPHCLLQVGFNRNGKQEVRIPDKGFAPHLWTYKGTSIGAYLEVGRDKANYVLIASNPKFNIHFRAAGLPNKSDYDYFQGKGKLKSASYTDWKKRVREEYKPRYDLATQKKKSEIYFQHLIDSLGD